MSILYFLASDNFITVNKTMIKAVGLEAAVLLGELASEHNYWEQRGGIDAEGFFFSTVKNIEEKTSLSAHQQRVAIEKLTAAGLIESLKMGMPAKRYVRILEEQVMKIFNDQSSKNSTTSDSIFEQQDVKNLSSNNNINKNNNIEKEYIKKKEAEPSAPAIIDELIPAEYLDLKETINAFIEMRKKQKKAPTPKALRLIIQKAQKLSEGHPDKMKQIFERSIIKGWLDVYPYEDDTKPRPRSSSGSASGETNPFTRLLEQEGLR